MGRKGVSLNGENTSYLLTWGGGVQRLVASRNKAFPT